MLVGASLLALVWQGFNYGIDFMGGTLIEVTYAAPKSLGDLRQELAGAGYPDAEPQSFSRTNAFAIRLKGTQQLEPQAIEALVSKLQAADPSNTLRVDRQEFVGPAVGQHLKQQAVLAIALAMVAIIIYVAYRFSNPLWGAAGVIALVHDVLATAGLFALTHKEVDLVVVAAFLTIAGYSINDTIVIFDRMREKLRLPKHESIGVIINASINEMLARTFMTNGNVLVAVLGLLVLGGDVLRDFALAMVFGGVIGTYTTLAIAGPLIYEMERRRQGARVLR